MKVDLPQNAFYGLNLLHPSPCCDGQLKASVSGLACAVLGIREEIVINFCFLIVTHIGQQCKDPVLITISLPVE